MESPEEQQKLPKQEGPDELTGIHLHETKNVAAGIPAIASSLKHMLSEMDITRAAKGLFSLNQTDGYDCPGCAWPDPDEDRSKLGEYCENGAKAIAEEATTKIIDREFFKKYTVSELSLLSDYEIGKKGRIAEPVYLSPGSEKYEPVTWDKAFEIIADELKKCSDPDDAVFYTSGRTSNEAAFLYQLFVRQFGTNNLPDCSNMCHESSGVALTESLGLGKGSVTLNDFYEAEVIIILGQNPGTNHPRMLSALERAKKNGCKIISVNPLKETGLLAFNNPQTAKGLIGIKTQLTDLFLQIKINTDMALMQAIEKILLEEEEINGNVFDQRFIQEHTENYLELIQHLKSINLDELVDACGISCDEIKAAADILKNKSKIIACWAMGLTQHKNAVDTIKEVVNLLLLKGSIGKPGAGTCPVRGHSNVQGDRTMGIYEKPAKEFLDAIEKVYSFSPPRKNGLDTVESIHAMHQGKIKFFMAMGGNFLSATPDTTYTAEALRNCELTVQISTKLNRSHLITGKSALILPTLGRSDKDFIGNEQQFVTTENSMGVVQMSKGNLNPVSKNLLSEPAIVCKIASAYFKENKHHWKKYLINYDNIRDDISKIIPGFENYNSRVRKAGGFYLPNPPREKTFTTKSGKAAFTKSDFVNHKLNKGEYLMMTIRSHDQFNTTIYGLNDRYRGISNERRIILINRQDMLEAGLKQMDVIDIINNSDGIQRVAHTFLVIEYEIPRSCTATYFPETNVLVPISSTAEKSNTPASKSIVISIRKCVFKTEN